MATWIFQYNPDIYKIERCVEQEAVWPLDVKQNKGSISEGDLAYVWVSGGQRQTTQAGIIASGTVLCPPKHVEANHDDPYLQPGHGSEPGWVVDVQFERKFSPADRIPRTFLKADWRTSRLQLLRRVPGTNFKVNKTAERVIEEYIAGVCRTPQYDPAQEEGMEDHWEGVPQAKLLTVYERESKARVACIAFYGYACQVCGVKLADVYGDIGKDFIHVHHIKFLSSHKKAYKIIPEKDLLPVCPNCHSMLHKKDASTGKYLTVEELKKLVKGNPATLDQPLLGGLPG